MTPTNREIAEHLLACYDTIYIVLGESAPTLHQRRLRRADLRDGPRLRRAGARTARTPGCERRGTDSRCSRASFAPPSPVTTLVRWCSTPWRWSWGRDCWCRCWTRRNSLSNDAELTELFRRRLHGLRARDPSDRRGRQGPGSRSRIEAWLAHARELAETFESAGNAESLGISRY